MTLAKTPWYWETVTGNLALLDEWGGLHHSPSSDAQPCRMLHLSRARNGEYMPEAPVNVMAQFHPDNFCDPASLKYRDKYEEIARRPTHRELETSWRRARELALEFETATFERRNTFSTSAILEI
jgi:putative pyruvate formate lyase activating enzyme